eukprot:7492712-Pyramimonas_sp.AAC.1
MFPRSTPRKGMLEILGHTLEAHIADASGHSESRQVLMPPVVLGRANSSTLYNALESTLPEASTAAVVELSNQFGVITLSEVLDNAATNIRKRAFTHSSLPSNVLATTHGCSAHLCQRVLEKATTMKSLVGDVHAVHVVVRQPGFSNALSKALRDIVEAPGGLRIVPGPPPDPTWRNRTKSILEHTLLRR